MRLSIEKQIIKLKPVKSREDKDWYGMFSRSDVSAI